METEEDIAVKFFIPFAEDEAQTEEVYNATKEFATQQTGWGVVDRRIFSLSYKHDGKRYLAEVGQIDERVNEPIIAILESDNSAYLICATNRGVLRGGPIMITKGWVTSSIDFEE